MSHQKTKATPWRDSSSEIKAQYDHVEQLPPREKVMYYTDVMGFTPRQIMKKMNCSLNFVLKNINYHGDTA